MSGVLVYILGRSGTGKSYSLRNFPKDKVAVINVQGKILPFRGSAQIEQTETDNSAKILKALEIYAQQGFKTIVVDDYQYVMSNEFMRRSQESGWDKFTDIARHAWDIAQKVRELPSDVIVYIMCHTDRDDNGNEKIKTIGRLLDEKICLEGLSTIVLKTNVSDGVYTFLTQNNGKDTVKSPADMFPSYAIDNDLWYVDQKIRNYYGMSGSATDEDMAQMDAAAKTEITKEDAGKRSRRRTQATTPAPAETSTDAAKQPAQAAEKATAAPAQDPQTEEKTANGEEVKQAAEAPAEEKKEEVGRKHAAAADSAADAEAGTRPARRRKARTDSAEQPQAAVTETPAETPAPARRRRRKPQTAAEKAEQAQKELDQFLNLPEGEEDLPFV